MNEKPEEVKLTVRIPATVHASLVTLASGERRSLNAQIVHMIEEAASQESRTLLDLFNLIEDRFPKAVSV